MKRELILPSSGQRRRDWLKLVLTGATPPVFKRKRYPVNGDAVVGPGVPLTRSPLEIGRAMMRAAGKEV